MKKLLIVPAILVMSASFASAGSYYTVPSFNIGNVSASANVSQLITQNHGWNNYASQNAQVVQNSPTFSGYGPVKVRLGNATASANVYQTITQTYGKYNTALQNATVIQNSPTWSPAP
ncbi:hypothetical protein [Methylocystis parvus]|uniref:hypothetical protein n=1 Tax=Methylocystis parvus TaxID=134 RepID=UPI003C7935D4